MTRLVTYRVLYWIGYVCWIAGFLMVFVFKVPVSVRIAGGIALALGVLVGWRARRMRKAHPELSINRESRESVTSPPIRSWWIVAWMIGVLLAFGGASALIMFGNFSSSVNTAIALASTLVIVAPAWYLLRRRGPSRV